MARLFTIVVLLSVSLSVPAEDATKASPPSAEAMVYDAFFMRPLSLLGTALGTGVFLVTLPVSAISGNVSDAAESLVAEPARSTFKRCLGCTAPAGTPSGM